MKRRREGALRALGFGRRRRRQREPAENWFTAPFHLLSYELEEKGKTTDLAFKERLSLAMYVFLNGNGRSPLPSLLYASVID